MNLVSMGQQQGESTGGVSGAHTQHSQPHGRQKPHNLELSRGKKKKKKERKNVIFRTVNRRLNCMAGSPSYTCWTGFNVG